MPAPALTSKTIKRGTGSAFLVLTALVTMRGVRFVWKPVPPGGLDYCPVFLAAFLLARRSLSRHVITNSVWRLNYGAGSIGAKRLGPSVVVVGVVVVAAVVLRLGGPAPLCTH